MPEDLHVVRKSISSRISKILSEYGLENSESGGKYPDLRQPVNTETGYWQGKSVPSKPSRLIVHIRTLEDSVGVRLPPSNTNGNFAYANTARRHVGGLLVRVFPVIEIEDERFFPYPDWEWLLWYCFWPKLQHGSSGQLFDGFDPASGTFTYMGQVQPYISAGLVTLIEPEEEFLHPDTGQPLFTYWEATEALREFIKVSPTSPHVTEDHEDA